MSDQTQLTQEELIRFLKQNCKGFYPEDFSYIDYQDTKTVSFNYGVDVNKRQGSLEKEVNNIFQNLEKVGSKLLKFYSYDTDGATECITTYYCEITIAKWK